MELWCPFAARKPLGPQTEPTIGKPRIFIIHTMSGYLAGTDSMFRQGGYSGTESHFGIGGQFDGANDGAIWQWQDLSHGADAQYSGNAYATSVETSDGARSGVRWSPKQAESIVRLGVWWCKETGNPARLVTSPSESGFAYHAQFGTWNHEAHDCPGAARLRQYKTEIIPEIARRLAGRGTEDDMQPNDSIGVGKTYGKDYQHEAYPASFIWVGAHAEAKRANHKLDELLARTAAQGAAIGELTKTVASLAANPGDVDVDALMQRISDEIEKVTVRLEIGQPPEESTA